VWLTSLSAMPLLDPQGSLPYQPSRVIVAGTAGSGKTTMAARIAEVLGLQHVEIDALFHGPDWTPRPTFLEDVHRFAAEPAWVTEWQYSSARAHLAARADLVVWLDLPKRVVMLQVIRRTLTRRLRRQHLWNGNIEPPLRTILTDPDYIVRWAWRTRHKTEDRINTLLHEDPDRLVVRLRTHEEANQWLSGPLRDTVSESELPMRVSCRGLVFDDAGRVLLAQHRIDGGTAWVGPGRHRSRRNPCASARPGAVRRDRSRAHGP
jgi:adenylate kinase family enzyme